MEPDVIAHDPAAISDVISIHRIVANFRYGIIHHNTVHDSTRGRTIRHGASGTGDGDIFNQIVGALHLTLPASPDSYRKRFVHNISVSSVTRGADDIYIVEP